MFKIKVNDYVQEPKEIECCVVVFDFDGREIRVSQTKEGRLKIMADDQLVVLPRASNVAEVYNNSY